MAIQINGNGTITGISSGGLPAGSVTSATLADGAASGTKLTLPNGSMVQYVRASNQEMNDRASHNANSWYNTGMQIQITPTDATNRIIVEGQFCCHCDNSAAGIYLAWDDGGNTLDYSASIEYYPNQGWRTIPVRYERIAGSTNQLTFTLMMYKYGNGTIYTGWDSSWSSQAVHGNGAYAVAYEVKE